MNLTPTCGYALGSDVEPAADARPVVRPQSQSVSPLLRQRATCPTCSAAVAGLLAGCDKPLCRRADLDFDAALDRRLDR